MFKTPIRATNKSTTAAASCARPNSSNDASIMTKRFVPSVNATSPTTTATPRLYRRSYYAEHHSRPSSSTVSKSRSTSSFAAALSQNQTARPHASYSLPHTQTRFSSHSPLSSTNAARKKTSLKTLVSMYERGEPITMLTAHDFPSAHAADHAGMDVILVGDSLAMVALGMEDTSEVTLDDMILHCRSVARGSKNAFLVGDLSMGCYEISPEQGLASAIRMVKEGRIHAVKLEGGLEMAPTIKKITSAGIPVLAHVGLTPQRQNSLGGFRVQGNTAAGALKVLADAMAAEEAGAFGVVLEAVPDQVATSITKKLRIPTIGIGAGNGTSGQVLVQVDMSGNFPQGRFLPKFVKKFGDVWSENIRAIQAYHDEVKSREYPAKEHTYPIRQDELEKFEHVLQEKA